MKTYQYSEDKDGIACVVSLIGRAFTWSWPPFEHTVRQDTYYSDRGIIWRDSSGRRVDLFSEIALEENYNAWKFRSKKFGHEF